MGREGGGSRLNGGERKLAKDNLRFGTVFWPGDCDDCLEEGKPFIEGDDGVGEVVIGGMESVGVFFLFAGTGLSVMDCFNKDVLGETAGRADPNLRERSKPPLNLDSASSTNDSCILEPNVGVPHLDDERSIQRSLDLSMPA